MPENNVERIEAVAADAWKRWPVRTAAAEAARRSYVRTRLSGEISYALMQQYDVFHETDNLSELINRLLADGEPHLSN
jgi:hypothetical protein